MRSSLTRLKCHLIYKKNKENFISNFEVIQRKKFLLEQALDNLSL